MSPLLNITDDDECLKFVYSMRSNFRVKITSHTTTVTLVNRAVDGGRAFHRAVIGLPQGVYKIVWETTDLRRSLGKGNSPHVRYRATVKEFSIHPAKCQIVGRCYHLLVIKIVAINFALFVSSMLYIALIALGMPHPHLIIGSWHMGFELQRLWEDQYHQYQTTNNRRQSSFTEQCKYLLRCTSFSWSCITKITKIIAWISKHTIWLMWDVITLPCHNFNGRWLGHVLSGCN